jgi:hypothetical protein
MVFSAFALSLEIFLLTIFYYLTFDPILQEGVDYQKNSYTSWALFFSLLV